MAVPSAPSNLTATPRTASIIDLAWQDNSADEDNFELEQSPNGTTGWTLINSPAANVTTYANTGLTTNTEYFYRIRAVNLDGASAYSNIASALTLLPGRAPLEPRLYLWQPDVILAAQVNWPVATYPIGHFDVDNITNGTVAAVKAGMTLLLGSAPGLSDLGRQRVRKDGAGARIFVGRSSFGHHDGELMVTDNAYVTVWNERRVFAKIPYISPTGEIFKDHDMPVEDHTTAPPPVAVMGAGYAGTIDPITALITVSFNGQNSYATADGATIVSYLWGITDGNLTGGTLADDAITATFDAGQRYVSLTVTDSNGNSHTTYRPVYARDPANDDSFDAFQIESHRITDAGQMVSVRILADMPEVTFPDGTLALIWMAESAGSGDRNHMLIVGWLDRDDSSMVATRVGLQRDTVLTIVDVAGRLDTLPGFPQSIADDLSRDTELIPAITWSYMLAPNLDKYLHYLLHWHSTALEVADFIWSGDGASYPFTLLASDGDSLWNQVDRVARAFVPDRVLTCDQGDIIRVVPDPQLANPTDRTTVVQDAIDENEWSDIRFTYQRAPRTHWLRAGAILAAAWASLPLDGNGDKYIPTVFSIAPGDAPGQGVGALTQGEQLAISQAALNDATGHRYARVNAPVGPVTVTLLQDDGGAGANLPWATLEPALKQWVTLTVSAATAARRGLTWTAIRALLKEINIRYAQTRAGLARTLTLTLELETVGAAGATVVKPVDVPPVGEDLPPPALPYVPDFGLVEGVQVLAAFDADATNGPLYRTADFQTVSGSGGPTWTRVALGLADTRVFSFVVDPFSPGYINGVGAINAWLVTEAAVYRVTDVFGATPGVANVHTFAVPISASSVFQTRTIQASFGRYFPTESDNPWLMVVSHYANAINHTGTRAIYSLDAGATWSSEVVISPYYDTDVAGDDPRVEIGVYLSPKTPGYAIASAYTATLTPAPAAGYFSTDWGETWTVMQTSEDSVADPLPMMALFDNDDNSTTLLGLRARASHQIGVFAASGEGIIEDQRTLVVAPPVNTARLEITCNWSSVRDRMGTSSSASASFQEQKHADVTLTGTDNYTLPAYGSGTSGTFDLTFTFGGGDWPVNRDSIQSSPPTSSGQIGARIWTSLAAQGFGGGGFGYITIFVEVIVTEIELDGGHIYTPAPSTPYLLDPGHRPSGGIHVPWMENDSELLVLSSKTLRGATLGYGTNRAAGDGVTIADISPVASLVDYGPHRSGFSVRAYDSDRIYLVMGASGNDASAVTTDDDHALFVSSNGGDTWTLVLGPTADASFGAFKGYSAAFAGDNRNVIFLFGAPSGVTGCIAYTSDFGAMVDERVGNLGSFGISSILGIAGGPTGGA